MRVLGFPSKAVLSREDDILGCMHWAPAPMLNLEP